MRGDDITEDLEKLIDAHGLTHVLVGLACVCNEKAEHLRANWQDEPAANSWAKGCARNREGCG